MVIVTGMLSGIFCIPSAVVGQSYRRRLGLRARALVKKFQIYTFLGRSRIRVRLLEVKCLGLEPASWRLVKKVRWKGLGLFFVQSGRAEIFVAEFLVGLSGTLEIALSEIFSGVGHKQLGRF